MNIQRSVGNLYAGVALALALAVLIDWLTGWMAYCWLRWQAIQLAYVYGMTIGVLAFILVLKDRKLAAWILLPALFPFVWSVVEHLIGFQPGCPSPGL
jgi:hypothetical protein